MALAGEAEDEEGEVAALEELGQLAEQVASMYAGGCTCISRRVCLKGHGGGAGGGEAISGAGGHVYIRKWVQVTTCLCNRLTQHGPWWPEHQFTPLSPEDCPCIKPICLCSSTSRIPPTCRPHNPPCLHEHSTCKRLTPGNPCHPLSVQPLHAGHGTSAADLLSLLRSLHSHALSHPPTHLALLAWGAAPFLPKLAPGDAGALAAELEGWAEGEEVAAARAAAEEEGEEGDEEAWAPFDTYLKMVKVRGMSGVGGGGVAG